VLFKIPPTSVPVEVLGGRNRRFRLAGAAIFSPPVHSLPMRTPPAVIGPDSEGWRTLVREIERCRACPLGATREHVVVYRGASQPRLVFVGEAPGRQEDRLGLPFVGRSGQRLDAAVERLGLAPRSVGILNVVKCHPPGNRLAEASVRACRPFLARQLALLRPKVLVPLGRHALRALLPSAPKVTEVAGAPVAGSRPPIFPLIHPAAALRSRRLAARWDGDLDRLRVWLGTTSV
jgi:uracil-DNA glycosylase family 4